MFNKVLMAFILFFSSCGSSKKSNEKILKFTEYEGRFRYFILIDKNWKESVYQEDRFYTLDDHTEITNTKNCIVTYRNGNVAYESKEFRDYPVEITFMEEGMTNNEVYTKEELTAGNKFFKITFSKSPVYPEDRNYYESRITNLSNQKVQVLKFGGFEKTSDNRYILNTITGDFFSSSDFNNWYMDSPERWINHNETVSDPINYGGGDGYWAYQVKTESGDTLWFGSKF